MDVANPTPERRTLPQQISRWWMAFDALTRGLVILVAVRIMVALIFMWDWLPLAIRFRWFLQHGGDQDIFFRMARDILAGNPQPELVGLGQALVMLPFIAWLKPFNAIDIAMPMVLINGFLLGGLSVALVGRLAKLTTGNDHVALGAAGLWAVLPLLTYFAFFWHPEFVLLRSANVPKVGWLNGLSDGPATFWVLVAATLLAANIKTQRMPGYFWKLAFAGAAMGLAVTFRVHVIPMVAVLMLYTLLAHDFRALSVVLIGATIAYVPQAWYNQTVFDVPVTIGYLAYWNTHEGSLFTGGLFGVPLPALLTQLPFSPSALVDNATYHIGRRPWLLIPLGVGLATAAAVTVEVWRKHGWKSAALLLVLPAAYMVPMAMSWPFREDIIRFSIPAMPYAIIVGVFAAVAIIQRVVPTAPEQEQAHTERQ